MSFHPDDTRHPLDQLRDYDRETWDGVDAGLNPSVTRVIPGPDRPVLAEVMAANLLLKALDATLEVPEDITSSEKIAILRAVQTATRAYQEYQPSLPCPCCGRTNTPATTSSEDKATTGESDA